MEKIMIFIAGSKNLVKERECINLIANDINSTYNGNEAMIIIRSYKHFNDQQSEYNIFIREHADIVIFIIDGHLGQYTEEEFLIATDEMNKTNRPEVMVFLHEFNELTPEIGRIQGLLKGRLGDKYYVEYSDSNDLKAKARERIDRYLKKHSVKTRNSLVGSKDNNRKKTNIISNKAKGLLVLMLCVVSALLGGFLWNTFSPRHLLIFAGGGSVRNYLDEKLSKNQSTRNDSIIGYPNSIYANSASGVAWSLLEEEADRYSEDQGRSHEMFSTICLSADTLDSTFIKKLTVDNKTISKHARIIGYHLGEDPLVVYVHPKIMTMKNIPLESVSINIDSLRSLVKYAITNPNEVRLFTTSKNSGTLRMYQNCFNLEDSIYFDQLLDKQYSFLFKWKSSMSFISALIDKVNLPYIILGSEYYYPEILKQTNDQYYGLKVKKDGNDINKPMYLYFIANMATEESAYCTINKHVFEFLKDIKANENIDEDTWNELKQGKIKVEGSTMILKLKEKRKQ